MEKQQEYEEIKLINVKEINKYKQIIKNLKLIIGGMFLLFTVSTIENGKLYVEKNKIQKENIEFKVNTLQMWDNLKGHLNNIVNDIPKLEGLRHNQYNHLAEAIKKNMTQEDIEYLIKNTELGMSLGGGEE